MTTAWRSAWEVFLLFTVPIGGGIPAGVLLAKVRGLSWVVMELLYFVSDVCLACVFEPIMLGVIHMAKKSSKAARLAEVFRQTMQRTTAPYGTAAGPVALILIAFGVDPMTGRSAAKAAGHGFVTGWALAITGDMMYFTVLMISTLWLNRWLNPTATIVVVILAMIFVPGLIRRIRGRVKKPS